MTQPLPQSRQSGATLLELLIVVAIVGILATVSALTLDSAGYARSVRGFADEISATCDLARQRAVAARRWQRLEFGAGALTHWEATAEGMAPPEWWQKLRDVPAPNGVRVAAVAERAEIQPGRDGDATPIEAVGDAGFAIEFSPDGSGQAATVYIGGADDDIGVGQGARVVVYRVTGSAYVYEGW